MSWLKLFSGGWVLKDVKGVLKVVLLVIAAIVAVKFLPLIFAAGCALAAALVACIALGASAMVALFGTVIVLTAVLSPIWIPVLALIGLITLVKRSNRKSVGLAA